MVPTKACLRHVSGRLAPLMCFRLKLTGPTVVPYLVCALVSNKYVLSEPVFATRRQPG
jgi:hypothetical protein